MDRGFGDGAVKALTRRMEAHEKYFGQDHVTVIEPRRGWRMLDLAELWAYRELVGVLAQRDIRVRYKQTVLGAAWAVLQPLATMLLFTVVFGHFARVPSDGLPYPIFVYSALLPWTFFANTVSASGLSLVNSQQLVSKVYFPRLVIPLSTLGAPLLDFAVASLILLGLMSWYGIGWTPQLLAAPVLIAALVFIALGVGTLLSALIVSYRDFRYVIPFMVQFWLFATPVIYPASLIPETYRWLLFLNPMAGVIDGFRATFLGLPFNWPGIALSLAVGMVIFVAGVAYFERTERRFADII